MKNCVKCGKSLPETAMHCVFCGSRQDAAPVPGSPQGPAGVQAKTIMGYAAAGVAEELRKQQQQQPPGHQPQPLRPAGPQPGVRPSGVAATVALQTDRNSPGLAATVALEPPHRHGPAAGPPGAIPPTEKISSNVAPTMMAPGPSSAFSPQRGAPPQGGPYQGVPAGYMGNSPSGPAPHPAAHHPSGPMAGHPMGGPPPGQPMYGPPPGAPMPAHGAPGSGPYPGMPPSSGPMPMMPHGPGSGPHVGAPHPLAGPQPMPHPGGLYANRVQPPTAQVQPLQPPPYLASGTPARMGAPAEPWVDTLKNVMLVFGIALVACFVLPWSLEPTLAFSWDTIKNAPGDSHKLIPLLIGGTGLLAVVLSLLPLTVSARGVAAAFMGIIPVGLQGFLIAEDVSWPAIVTFVGFLTLIPGLLLRSEYHGAVVARVIVTMGVLCLLVPELVPQGGDVPLIMTFKSIGIAAGKGKLIPIIEAVWVLLALLGLLAWLPPPGAAGAKILAWIFIVKPFFDTLVLMLLSTELSQVASMLKSQLYPILLLPLAIMAWNALNGYGVASVVGKSLEHAEG